LRIRVFSSRRRTFNVSFLRYLRGMEAICGVERHSAPIAECKKIWARVLLLDLVLRIVAEES